MRYISILLIFSAIAPVALGSQLSSDELDSYISQVSHTKKACGPLALWYCLQLLGNRSVTKDEVLADVQIGERGVSLAELVLQSKRFGVTCRSVKVHPTDLTKLAFPSIVVVDNTHCVVLTGLSDDSMNAFVFDPSTSSYFAPRVVELKKHFNGQAIVFADARLSHLSFIICVIVVCCAELIFVFLLRSLMRRMRCFASGHLYRQEPYRFTNELL